MKNFNSLFSIIVIFVAQNGLAKPEPSALCDKNEKPIFACQKKEKTFTLCASNDLSKTSGYLKYRARKSGKIEMEYPKDKTHPLGKFMSSLGTKGVSVIFSNGGFNYILYSDAGTDVVTVEKDSHDVSRITCEAISDDIDLSMTSTMDLLKKAGLECDAEDCLKN